MGSGNSKRRLRETEEEIKRLRGRLHEIPQKNEELARVKLELERTRKRLANSAAAELERENKSLRNANNELHEDLQKAKSDIDRYRSVTDLSRNTRGRTSNASLLGSGTRLTDLGKNDEKKRQARMQGISAEPGKYNDSDIINTALEKHPKDQR